MVKVSHIRSVNGHDLVYSTTVVKQPHAQLDFKGVFRIVQQSLNHGSVGMHGAGLRNESIPKNNVTVPADNVHVMIM